VILKIELPDQHQHHLKPVAYANLDTLLNQKLWGLCLPAVWHFEQSLGGSADVVESWRINAVEVSCWK
jgi:hypothetical protein